MESKALREYKVPDYPQKEQVHAQPSLLRKSVYNRWQKLYDLGISGMLIAGLSLSGCDKKNDTNTTSTQDIVASPNQNQNASQINSVSTAKVAALVSPIFEHGEGRGAIGCEVIAPPAFISEEEALIVIKEEFAKHGIEFDREKIQLSEIQISPVEVRYDREKGIVKEEKKSESLEVDLQDTKRNINIEYISREDNSKLEFEAILSSVQNYNTMEIAKEVRNKIQSNVKQGVYGVFYDPLKMFSLMASGTDDIDSYTKQIEKSQTESLESAKELLRNQVQDFAQWLKEQGVIK